MQSLPLFIAASMALIITPGPDIFYVLTRGIADGRWAGVMSAAGITSGILVHTLAASLGLAVLLQTSVYAFWTLKICGGLYIIYLGFQMIKNKDVLEFSPLRNGLDLKKCFAQGFLCNVLNPKVAVFFLAFLPQFAKMDSPNHSLYMIGLGLIYYLLSIMFMVTLGLFSGWIGTWLSSRTTIAGKIRLSSGTVLMLLGLSLLVPQRH
ncbi:MAG: LysE family translocator [Desulfohalobiaceae bacterium]|nr:LysE family translocator [Desulfohalobiaceae bacterium]